MHSFRFSKAKLAALSALLMIFSACSHLDSTSSANINFKINMARTAISEIEGVKATIELKGGLEQAQTKALDTSKKTAEFSFTDIPVGTEVYAQAEIFVEVEGEKKLLYSGKSETTIIAEGTNELKITLEKLFEDEEDKEDDEKEKEDEEEAKYNLVTKTDTTYVVENPTFTIEWDKDLGKALPLSTNEITFNKAKDYENFIWEPSETAIKISDYQKAIITYKGSNLKTDEENVIALFTRRGSFRNYGGDQKAVTDESSSFEMFIPQGKGRTQLLIQNKWASENGQNGWEKDFSFVVEKIELIKDPALVIDYTKSTYADDKIQLLRNINNEPDYSIGANSIKWKSKEFSQNGNDSGWASAYWEFEKLTDYDVVKVTVKGLNPNQYGMKFGIHGHRPFHTRQDYNDEQTDDIHSKFEKTITLENANESKTFEIDIADLCTYADSYEPDAEVKPFVPTALEFQNLSYAEEGAWTDNMVWGEDWTLVIEKIELIKKAPEKLDYKSIGINNFWQFKIFNEYRNVVSLKSATADSITFTINHAFDSSAANPERVQVVFGDMPFEEDGKYVCSYKLKGPDTNEMNVCCWVDRDQTYTNGNQAELSSAYNSASFTEHSFIIDCDTTKDGSILFFPETPGEYTISDVEVRSIVKKDVSLQITLPEVDDGDISVSVKKDGEEAVTSSSTLSATTTSSLVFTADAGYDSYTWKVDGEEKFNSTNTYTLILADAVDGAVYDITLLAHKEESDEYHSYSVQVKVTE